MAQSRNKAYKEIEQTRRIVQDFDVKILTPGDAVNYPKYGDSVAVHYAGYLENGTCFDDSFARGQPIYFILGAGQVLKGWEAVLPILSRGQKAKITLNPEMGYGEKGYPPIIPPNSILIYEIELISFSSMGNAERLHRELKAKKSHEQT